MHLAPHISGLVAIPVVDVGSNNLMEWETIAGGMMIAFGVATRFASWAETT